MKTRLATLEVWSDDSVTGESSVTQHHKDTKEWKITLRPNDDMKFSKYGSQTEDVLAHELGHFVAEVVGRKAQRQSGYFYSTPAQNLAGEKDAWEIARKIKPDIPKAIEKDALDAYRKIVRENPPDIPMGILGL
jgi:hypothetical protein